MDTPRIYSAKMGPNQSIPWLNLSIESGGQAGSIDDPAGSSDHGAGRRRGRGVAGPRDDAHGLVGYMDICGIIDDVIDSMSLFI